MIRALLCMLILSLSLGGFAPSHVMAADHGKMASAVMEMEHPQQDNNHDCCDNTESAASNTDCAGDCGDCRLLSLSAMVTTLPSWSFSPSFERIPIWQAITPSWSLPLDRPPNTLS